MLVQRWKSKPWPGVGLDWTHPLTQGLVGCWIFNEESGLTVHNYGLSGSTNDGVLTNAYGTGLPTWVGSPSGGGVYTTSVAQTAGDTYIECGSISGFASATNVSLFFKGRQASTPRYMMFGVGTDSDNRFQIETWSDGNTYISIKSNVYPYFSSPSGDFSLGATFDGSQVEASRVKAYANGVPQALTGTYSGTTLGSTTAVINLGRFDDAGSYGYSDGRWDVAMMWAGRTLTAQDIQDLHTNPWQIFEPNPSYFLFGITGVESDTGSATITAAATIAATGLVTAATGVAGVTASATIAATGLATYTGSAGVTATGTIAATGLVTAATGEAGVTASATIAATGLATYTGSVDITAAATISATGLVTAATGVAGISASATIAATGEVAFAYKSLVQRWKSKPWPGVGLNWTHPLTNGLVGCWIFNEQYGPYVYNLGASGAANNGVFSTKGTALPTWVGSPSGGGVYTTSSVQTGTDTYLDCGAITGFASATNASLFFMGRQAATPRYMIFGIDPGRAFTIELWDDGLCYIQISGEYPYCSNPTGDFSVGATFDGSQAAASRIQAYINGVQQTLTGTISSTALASNASLINLGGYASESAFSDGRFDVAMMWAGRTLTPQDISDLHGDLWQIFQPNIAYQFFESGVESVTGSANITAAATIAATGLVTVASGVAGITAAATIAATGLATYTGSAGITATGTIAATGLVTAATGVAGVTASATIAATGIATEPGTGTVDITAAATISATGLVTAATGVAGVTATATISATGTLPDVFTGSGTITAAATISATGLVTAATGVAGITASGTISAIGKVTSASGVAVITSTSTISASGISTTAVILPEIYPDPFAASLLTTYTPFSAVLSTTSTPFGATSVIGQVTSPRLTGRWYHLQGGGITTSYASQLQKTFPVAVTEGSLIVVGLGNDTNGGTFTVSDNINNTPYAVAVSGGGSLASGTATLLWFVVPQGGGGYPFTVTFDSLNGTYPAMSIDEYMPPIGSVPSVESYRSAEGNNATATVASPLSITQMDLVVATCKVWGAGGQTVTPEAGFQTRYEVSWSSSPATNGLITADMVNRNTNMTPSFSLDPGSNWVMATAAFTPVPVAYESFMLLGLI